MIDPRTYPHIHMEDRTTMKPAQLELRLGRRLQPDEEVVLKRLRTVAAGRAAIRRLMTPLPPITVPWS